jgi:membrane protein YqaA with SNARE-associated domain
VSAVLHILTGLGVGLGSALLPLINAEAYAVVGAAADPWLLLAVVVALAAGQTVGKVVLLEAARRGSSRMRALPRLQALTESRWAQRVHVALSRRRTSLPLILVSAGVGLPPLALVSVAAGAAGHGRRSFAAMCLIGRVVRFAAIAVPAVVVRVAL